MLEIFKKLSKRELRLVIVLLTIIFSWGIYVIIFVPSITKLEKTENQLFELEKQKAQLNNKVRRYNQLKDKYQSYSFEKLALQFPNKGKVPQIILWVEELFQDPNLSRPSISFLRGEDKEQYLQLFLSFTGPYANVRDLIKKIEANERLTTIENTNLSSGTSNAITTNLTIKIYGEDFADVSVEKYDFNNIDLFYR
jgi:Tfp pilus assembly protein PilO